MISQFILEELSQCSKTDPSDVSLGVNFTEMNDGVVRGGESRKAMEMENN